MRFFAILLFVACGPTSPPAPDVPPDPKPDVTKEVTTPDTTPDVTQDPGVCKAIVLSEKEEGNLRPVYPDIDRKIVHLIPDEELDEFDRGANKYLLELVDSDCKTIGYAREINTGVGCLGSACAPIHYYECLDAGGVHKDVYCLESDPNFFRKFWEAKHVVFDAADMKLTRDFVANPPEEYLAVTPCPPGEEEEAIDCGPAELVELLPGGNIDTAPTIPKFIPITVRGGVFTIYKMILYRLATEAIVEGLK